MPRPSIRKPRNCTPRRNGSRSRPVPSLAILTEAGNTRRRHIARRTAGRGRCERATDVRATAQSLPVAERRAGIRLRQSGAVARAALEPGRHGRGAVAVQALAPITPTCCCRSRRSPKRPAPLSMPKGAVQSFNGVVKPLGDTRPAWKVLRVLGNLLEPAGFDFENSEVDAQGNHRCRQAGRRRLARASEQPDRSGAARPPLLPPARSSAWPMCRSTTPTRIVRRAASLQLTAMRRRRAPGFRRRCATLGMADGDSGARDAG